VKPRVANATVTIKEKKMSETNEKLLRELEVAAVAVRRGTGGKAGEGAEKKYGEAYRKCVQAGIKPRLKSSYR